LSTTKKRLTLSQSMRRNMSLPLKMWKLPNYTIVKSSKVISIIITSVKS